MWKKRNATKAKPRMGFRSNGTASRSYTFKKGLFKRIEGVARGGKRTGAGGKELESLSQIIFNR